MDELNKAMNDVNWLVSLLFAIPLSIAGNLLTPRFQTWRASKSRRAALRRLTIVEKELDQVEKLASNPSTLNSYLLVSLLAVLVLFSISNVINGFLSALFTVPASAGRFSILIGAISGMANALFNLMAVTRAWQAMTVYHRVQDYEIYSSEMVQTIAALRKSAA